MSILKPCASSDAFEFIPERENRLNLKDIAGKFRDVKIKTDIVLIVRYMGVDISIYPSGKMLLHTGDREKAEKLASAIRRIINE